MHIPLCRLVACSFVWPTLQLDINKLHGEFYNGYKERPQTFYKERPQTEETSIVMKEIKAEKRLVWRMLNEEFKEELDKHAGTKALWHWMNYVFDCN